MEKKKITKNMTFSEIIEKHPEAGEILFKEGLMCIMCGMAKTETIEQGAAAHEMDIDKLIEKLNKKLK